MSAVVICNDNKLIRGNRRFSEQFWEEVDDGLFTRFLNDWKDELKIFFWAIEAWAYSTDNRYTSPALLLLGQRNSWLERETFWPRFPFDIAPQTQRALVHKKNEVSEAQFHYCNYKFFLFCFYFVLSSDFSRGGQIDHSIWHALLAVVLIQYRRVQLQIVLLFDVKAALN